MDLPEQPRSTGEAPPSHDALLGLPPGVSAPSGVDAAPAAPATPAASAPAQQIEWYHLDPDTEYKELRLGAGPGLWRGLAFGGLLSALALGLFYACMWMIEPSAALLDPFVDRSYAEARDDMAIHLGGLAPVAAPASPNATTRPAGADKFNIADLRSAHRPSANGESNGGVTWYRFDLPREQVSPYREHLVNGWLASLKHRIDSGADATDSAFESSGAPPWWDAKEFDPQTRVRLLRSNGEVAFHAAFSAKRGRVYLRVNH